MSGRGTDDRRRWLALYVLCVGMLMIVLDATIVNVALPTIQEDLGFSQSDLAWVVNAYLIAFGGLLSGRIGDLIGQRRIFLTASPSSSARRFSAPSPKARASSSERASSKASAARSLPG
jgi:MFS family permease